MSDNNNKNNNKAADTDTNTKTTSPHSRPKKRVKIATPSPNTVDTFANSINDPTMLGCDWNGDSTKEMLFLELTRCMKENCVINITDRRMKEYCWINVQINADETTFKKTAKDWLGEAVKHNGSARWACSYLAFHYPEPMIAALKEKKFPVALTQ
jgi:hypothetical protein